jgi:hypothetical protein
VIELRGVYGFGSGIFAKKAFEATDIIFTEKPLLRARRAADTKELMKQVRNMPAQLLALLLTFEVNGGPNACALSAIFCSNAIPCVSEEEVDENDLEAAHNVPCAVFKYLSRINHCCTPNAGRFWDETKNRMRESRVDTHTHHSRQS